MSSRPAEPWTVERRWVLATSGVAALVAVLLLAVTHSVIDQTTGRVVDRVLADRAATVVDAIGVGQDAPPAVVGPGTAVYVRGELVAGSVPPSLDDQFGLIARSQARRTLGVGEDYRLLAVPFGSGHRAGVVVVVEQLAPYERDERVALVVAGVAGAVLVALAAAVAAWISRRALRPVQQMADAARAWSEHDLGRRFDLGAPTDELRALGLVFDELLDKVADAITAEQRLTAEMAHELRSPLTVVRATLELLDSRTDLDDDLRADLATVEDACRTMSTTVAVLLEEARGRTSMAHRASCNGSDLAAMLVASRGPERARLDLDLPPTLELRVPPELALRILRPVVDNALRFGDRVRVQASVEGRTVELVVSDDGPGVASGVVERLFEPGVTTDGSGLGLALSRRLARGAGGDVVLRRTPRQRGASFVVRLPGDRHLDE